MRFRNLLLFFSVLVPCPEVVVRFSLEIFMRGCDRAELRKKKCALKERTNKEKRV